MLSDVVDLLVRGSYGAWASIGGVWILTAIVVLAHRRDARSSGLRVLALLALASATSVAGFAVATAVAVPRLRWVTAPADPLALPKGDTWRRLRGPSVLVTSAGDPDLAIPSIDADGLWVLVGLISGRRVPGIAPAPLVPPVAGAPRICANDDDTCRAWPSTWPDPSRTPRGVDLTWTKTSPLSALAFDVESGNYLTSLGELAGPERALDIIGRVSNDAPRDVVSSLFVLRRLVGGASVDPSSRSLTPRRLQAVRVVSMPVGGTYAFYLQRIDVSLAAGPIALDLAARPLLVAAILFFPLALLAYLASPLLFSRWLRSKKAVRRALDKSLTLSPVLSDSVSLSDVVLCAVGDDVDIGGASLARGAIVRVAFAGHGGARFTSRSWLEIPPAPPRDTGPKLFFRAEPELPKTDGPYVGLLVPADLVLFWGASMTWLTQTLRPFALCVAGVAAAAPGLVAVVSLLGT